MIYKKDLICTWITAFFLVFLNFQYIDLFRQKNFRPAIANIDCMGTIPMPGQLVYPKDLWNATSRSSLIKT